MPVPAFSRPSGLAELEEERGCLRFVPCRAVIRLRGGDASVACNVRGRSIVKVVPMPSALRHCSWPCSMSR